MEPMVSLEEKLRSLIKPLQLEIKQCSNRSVMGGFDRFLMKKCEEILGDLAPLSGGETAPFASFLKELRGSFSQ